MTASPSSTTVVWWRGTEGELLALVTDVKSVTVQTGLAAGVAREALVERLAVLPDVRRAAFDEGSDTLRVDVALALDDLTGLLAVFMEQGVRIESLTSEAPNLETTFLALTGRELRQG